jgi:hypothetical protein
MRARPSARHHLDAGQVLDYIENRLGAKQQARVEDHLAGPCTRCRDLVHEVGRLLESMRSDRVPPVPEAVRARALEAFGTRVSEPSRAGLAWTLARTVFDSIADPMPAPVRRSLGKARWMRFELGDHLLEMEAEPEAGEAWTLRGRLGIPEPALHRIDAEAAGERHSAWPDTEGHFVLERVPAGAVEIRITGPDARHRLPPLSL